PDGTYTGNPALDVQYETWVYAAVVGADGNLDGIYLTKDNGQNWTQLQIPRFRIRQFNPVNGPDVDIPTNDPTRVALAPFSAAFFAPQANSMISFAIDPNNPNITYLGGTTGYSGNVSLDGPTWGLIKIDSTALTDPHAVFMGDDKADGGLLRNATTDSTSFN